MITEDFGSIMDKCPFFQNCKLGKTTTCSNFNYYVNCPEYVIKKKSIIQDKLRLSTRKFKKHGSREANISYPPGIQASTLSSLLNIISCF